MIAPVSAQQVQAMMQTDRSRPHHAQSTRLADIANLALPSAAPRMIRFSEGNEHIFQVQRSLSSERVNDFDTAGFRI